MATISGTPKNDVLLGTPFRDKIFGEVGNDVLLGKAGNDRLDGGKGSDLLFGENGSDTLLGKAGKDFLLGGDGNDKLDGGKNNDILLGGIGKDLILGRFGNDRLSGGRGGDRLSGGRGGDTLRGGNGNDTLSGSRVTSAIKEIDKLTGGAGKDKFILGDATGVFYDDQQQAIGITNYALITDFNPNQDFIQLNGAKSNYILAASPIGLPVGQGIYINKLGSEPNELIAIVQGNANLSLDGNYFITTKNKTAAEFNLADLNGGNGFVINGINAGDRSGVSVSQAGDINGDGFDDLIIGAFGANVYSTPYGGEGASGESYVVFGQAESNANFNLADLNGSNGFAIAGILAEYGSTSLFGFSVSDAGDINGDGFDDVLIGAPRAGVGSYGESYVIFGQAGKFDSRISVYDLDGSNGFVINTVGGVNLGYSVSSAGDIDGDGFDDLLIGAPGTSSDNSSGRGNSYVVFGRSNFGATFDLTNLNNRNGFDLIGVTDYDFSGRSLSNVGDINGDGFDDLIIGAPGGIATYSPTDTPGQSYVVFGGTNNANFNLSNLNGSNGFVIDGINEGDRAGRSVSGGDINGDGFDDLIIGAYQATVNNQERAGESYVVFGQSDFNPSLNLADLNGSDGFTINGIDAYDYSGRNVSSAGDVNADGFDDILISAPFADPSNQQSAGETYLIFGQENFNPNFNLADINGSNGIVLNGIDAYDSANTSLFISNSVSAAGDVNGDGFDDIIIGASYAAANNQVDAGESYIVFGRDFNNSVTQTGTENNDLLIGTASKDILVGGLGNDTLIGNVDVLNGGAGDDIINFSASARRINGGSGTDTLSFESSNINVDLTAITNTKVIAFETIDITGTGDNSLNFTSLDVVDLSATTNQLVIKGSSGDAVTSIAQGWELLDTTKVDNMLYNRYRVGAATLLVDTDITQTMIS